jgi:hypothetical protein
LPEVVTVPDREMPLTVPVPPTLVTVPPPDAVLVIVKFGYVPLVDIPAPAVKDTTWSGAVLVMVNVPLVVIGLPEIEMPVLAVAATLVTVPEPLLLKVFQSVLVRYPLADVVAGGMLITGVVPPVEATGAVAVTDETLVAAAAVTKAVVAN